MTKRKTWRCYFCDDVFRSAEKAAQHFGVFEACEADEPACKLMQHQEHVVKYIRELEREVRGYQDDNQPLQKAIFALEDEMRRAVISAEERGYGRAVQDMMKQGRCPEPDVHQR